MKYLKIDLGNNKWVICEEGHNYLYPSKTKTFAFDTETQVYFKGQLLNDKKLFDKLKKMTTADKRKCLTNITWAWQCYDELNGFFMTNDFYVWLQYQCRCGYDFGWCYNSTFDFAQIDYEILAKKVKERKPHEHAKKGEGYNKGQAYTYESLHNDMGSRYAYKLRVPYKNKDRHIYVHAVQYHDFMKLVPNGLSRLLEDLNVVDNECNAIRKLEMEYQAVNTNLNAIKESEIDYCCNDVKGLYFALKQFNETLEEQTNNECHIFGTYTNIMTAGGLAKRELLRSLYPQFDTFKKRLQRFQKEHPITADFDKFVRENHLYRGGISYVNELYKGKLITGKIMYRYDVNSEYPYAMANIRDLIGYSKRITYEEYLKMKNKDDYEAILLLTSVYGVVKQNYLGFWYNPFEKKYVDIIEEEGLHLMFAREVDEMSYWYDDFTYTCEYVYIYKRGNYAYADFVNENYKLKALAKKEHNNTLQVVTKLKLNSSYGKLAERIERVSGKYELNAETGAIHFVRGDVEISLSSSMNVVIGALVTSYARCYILSKIREICGNDIKHKFVYIDTDSIHAFAPYDKADAFALGGLKLEATCEAIKYILPKTYIDIEKINANNTVDFGKMEIHSKGVNIKSIKNELKKRQKGKKKNLPTLELINRKFDYGVQYICLVAMNVVGGKVLVPTFKYLAKNNLRPANADETLIFTNYESAIYYEI